ncbi:MAG: MafI family immunity protein [Candidatus Wallbacteria bacterium]|nr:MafI family immunity protein [Candidatus Wallbacteria bacterium]
MKDLEDRFEKLLKVLPQGLTGADIEQVEELVQAGELGVAFENLCTQLYERSVVVPTWQIEELSAIGSVMGINPDYWEILASS